MHAHTHKRAHALTTSVLPVRAQIARHPELLEEVGTALLRQYDGGEGPSCTIYSSSVPEGPAGAAEVGTWLAAMNHALFVAWTA